MKDHFVLTWNSVMDSRFNPLRNVPLAARHWLMQVLGWMWSMIFSLSFLSIYAFGYVWVSHLLVIAGVFITISFFKAAEKREQKLLPAPYLSGASKTVWQMDREG